MNRFTLACAATVFATSLHAVDAVLNKPDGQQVYWGIPSIWIDAAGGGVLSEAPTNASDTVTFTTPVNTIYAQRIVTGWDQPTTRFANFSVGAVTGDHRHVVCHTYSWTEGKYAVDTRTLTVGDPNGFTGYWFSGDGCAKYVFPGSSVFSPRISDMSINGCPIVEIPSSDTVAGIGSLYNGGALEKTGEGRLDIGGTSGADTRLYLKEGEIGLSGHADDDRIDDLLAEAALHLDASVGATLIGYRDAEGRNSVTNWLDVRGNGRFAAVPAPSNRLKLVNPPFVAVDGSGNGLDMLDFGARAGDAVSMASFGPTNCTMSFAEIADAREVFYVARYHTKPGFNAVLGDFNKATLQPAGRLLGGSANFGARTGAIFADGVKIDATWWPDSGDGMTDLHVISFGSPSNMVFSTIASDQNYSERTGGMAIGEIIVFTNELSRADRLRINYHLNGKWLKKGVDVESDAGLLHFSENAGAVSVPAGRTARVNDLVSDGSAVVKKGEGVLEVDSVYPGSLAFDVRGGSVKISRFMPDIASNAPASSPAVWLDASRSDTYTVASADGYDDTFVTAWRSIAETEVTAVASAVEYPRKPTLVAGASPTGLDVIDFGNDDTTVSYFTFPWWGDYSARFKAGFAVIRPTVGDKTFVPVFGTKNMVSMREAGSAHKVLVSPGYPYPALAAAMWTLDGVPVDPRSENPYLAQKANFYVMAFSAREKVLVDAIAWARNSTLYCGGFQIGEFMLYDRELTDQERRDTEAYLMSKWNGQVHPAAVAPQATFDFADDVPAVYDIVSDMALAEHGGGCGAVVKRGGGSLVVSEAVDGDALGSISVEEGTLEIPVVRRDAFLDEALFHFDATDAGSLVKTEDGNGEEYISEWLDVRRNGMKATTVLEGENGWITRAPATEQVETSSGVFRPMLKFYGVASKSAAMFMNSSFDNVREGHTIHKDIGRNSLFFSHSQLNPAAGSAVNYNDYYRTTAGAFSTSAAAAVKNGYIAYNCVPAAWDEPMSTDVNLVSLAPLADTHVNSIQYDRTVPGGAYVGEQIAFPRTLEPEERAYLQNYLMWKWFADREKPVLTNAHLSVVSVAFGASLKIAGGADIHVDRLEGAGSIEAVALNSVTELGIDGTEGISVSGKVVFDGAVSVSFGAADLADKSSVGVYPLLSAGAFENLDLSLWTLTDAVSPDLKTKFRLQDGTVTLVVERAVDWMTILVR